MADRRPSAPTPVATKDQSTEVLVIGAGPSGAASAYWLAEAGHEVVLVEKKHFPREKTCGDGLTPRSVRQLEDMGLATELEAHHRYQGLRCLGFGKELVLPWPMRDGFPSYGYVVTRADLDQLVAAAAVKKGVTLIEGAEAVAPLYDDAGPGRGCGGAVVVNHDDSTTTNVRARCVVVADGANSRFGRALGTNRDRKIPLGMALRGYFESPRHDEPYIESHLDVRDEDGRVVPGYGWVFPLGDGRVNVGVGLISNTTKVNTTKLFDAFVKSAPPSWCLGAQSSLGAPTGGRLPMGLSVTPRIGADYLTVGDAAGSINPFNGEGIAYGYETGRIAASVVDEALRSGDLGSLARFEDRLQAEYGLYYKVASLFMTFMSRPHVMARLVGMGMYSRSMMEWLLRMMANLLRPDELGPAEAAYKALAVIARRSA